MSVYVYCIKEDHVHKTSITGREFENEWFKLEKDGNVTVKGSNKDGYAWDGCTPKFKIMDLYFGTPEAVLNLKTGKTKTYYAYLIHDIFYQFSKDLKPIVKRSEIDKEFYTILKEHEFKLAKIYYFFVHLVAWLFW